MDISSIWGQVLLNACGVRIQQNFPNIIVSQDPVPVLPLTYNAFIYHDNNLKSDDSDSDNEDENQEDIIDDNSNVANHENEINRNFEDNIEGINESIPNDNEESDEISNTKEEKTDKNKKKKKGKYKKTNRTRFSREEYQCPQCPYRCTTENAYVKHLRFCESSDQKPLSCPVCGKDRKCEQSLQLHLMKHKQGKQFCCDLCKFKSIQLKKIIQHRRMHTGEKPHLCPHCTYRSSRRDNLRSHVRRVHKEEDLTADTFSPTSMIKSASAKV